MRGFGKYIVLKHRGRFVTVYANLNTIRVNEGDRIGAGFRIGNTEMKKGSLHFQIDYAGKPQNPLKYLPGQG